jgi:hypothetical protein
VAQAAEFLGGRHGAFAIFAKFFVSSFGPFYVVGLKFVGVFAVDLFRGRVDWVSPDRAFPDPSSSDRVAADPGPTDWLFSWRLVLSAIFGRYAAAS